MSCPVCGHENDPGARFCSNCGTALAARCPVCDHEVADGMRFCSNCGTELRGASRPRAAGTSVPADVGAPPAADPSVVDAPAVPHPVPGPAPEAGPRPTSASATSDGDEGLGRYVPEPLLHKIRAARAAGSMRGERRNVTMLFADLQGSTAAAEHLDPEEWADVVNGAFEHLIAPVYRYEGTLARLQGDAVLAFFGAPIAHEDDPVRAVHAGLEMIGAIEGYAQAVRARLGLPIAVRVGINTGLVVVGEVGSDLRVEYTALGDAINVAARMEQTAAPGEVRIARGTADLLGGVFDLATIGPVEVHGRGEPVTALRVEGVASLRPSAGDRTPLVGRDAELQSFHEVTRRLLAGVGGVVTVVGEAGVGKSRLLAAVRDRLATTARLADRGDEEGEVVWLEGHCRSFDTGVPYSPFLDLASRWLDLSAFAHEIAYDRIERVARRALGHEDPDTSAYLANLAGAPLPDDAARLIGSLETPVLHEHTTEAVVTYLEAEARRQPMFIVLDDLHWADALSLQLAERLTASTETAPMVLVLSMRPVREDASWRLLEAVSREVAHRHTAIELGTLRDTDTEELLAALIEGRELPEGARERILERAGGNPLFIEEMARTLRGGGVSGAGDVPATLSGLLTSRLDQLDETDHQLVQIASVAGSRFASDTLEAVADGVEVGPALRRLVREGVLVEERRVPVPVHAFRHALLHETAYATVLLKDRRRLHTRIARHLEQASPESPHEIARHHLAGDDPVAAFPWLAQAGARSTRAMSLAEAIRLFTAALERAPSDPDPQVLARVHQGLGEAYSLIPDLDQAAGAYQELAELGRTLSLPDVEARALNRLGFNAAVIAADFEQARHYLDQARIVAENDNDQAGLAEYHMNSCFVAVAEGALDRAVDHDEEAARIGDRAGVGRVRAAGLVRRALNLVSATDPEAPAAVDEAGRVADAEEEVELRAVLRSQGEARLRQNEGDLAGALELAASAVATLERHGSFYVAMVHDAVGRLLRITGDLEGALARHAEAVRVARRRSQPFVAASGSAGLALCYALVDEHEGSAEHRRGALEALAEPMGGMFSSTVWADLGEAGIARGDWREAEADLALGLEASASTRFIERPRLLTAAARVALELGDPDGARRLLDEAEAHVAERGLVVDLPGIRLVRARIALAEGDVAGAEAELARGDEAATASDARPLDAEILALRVLVAEAGGRDEEAGELRRRRDGLIGELVGGIADEGLRARFADRLRVVPASRRATS